MGNFLNAIFRRDTPSADSEPSSTTQMESNPVDMERHASSTEKEPIMESTTLSGGARPKEKTQSAGDVPTGYAQFLLTLGSLFIRSHSLKLATWFGYPAGMIDNISNSDTPSRVFVQMMDDRGEISPSDISKLITALEHKTVGLGGVARKVKETFRLHVPIAPTSPVTTEKKTQFVTELKNKYKNLCGEIQPAPFLRDKYDIEELFVESGIKFLEGKEDENWIELKNYKKIFVDPQIKSKRRIIDGEPGYGKSTLALKITHDWCQEITPMKDFEILILLRLRQFRNVPTIYSAIKEFLLPFDSELTEDDIKGILDNSSTVILLDGYDEYPDRGNAKTDIERIISGDMFLKHEVVLTTRTSCLPPKCSRDTKRIRLTGFDEAARDTYIRNVVSSCCSTSADKINQFLKRNPVPADLCKIPLFFAMIAYMVHNYEKFHNLKTVTEFFRHIIKCFHSHKEIKVTDHSKLDKVAFEGLSGKAQQISWGRNELSDKIGKNLYDEYVRIGILIEEDGYDYDAMDYMTEVRFFHKLFAEWYAAHYLAKAAAQPEAEFDPWPKNELDSWQKPQRNAAHRLQPDQVANSDKVCSLKNINPNDVHYMYRYACGLNHDAALKIIKHFGTNENYGRYTLLCMTEWDGSLETIEETVTLLCSRRIEINDTDSLLLQKSTVELIEFASNRKIPIEWVGLCNCLDVGSHDNLHVKPSNMSLPVSGTFSVLWIYEEGREITDKDTYSILQYSAMCLELKQLVFIRCLLPRFIKATESFMSVLRSRDVRVEWFLGIGKVYPLNLESGQWEYVRDRTPMTDEQYQKQVDFIHFYKLAEANVQNASGVVGSLNETRIEKRINEMSQLV